MTKKWYNFYQDEKADIAEISLFNDIGYGGITLDDFAQDFALIKDKKEINVYINSMGGSVFDGLSIYNLLSNTNTHVITHNIGIAASIASIIFLSGKDRIMYDGTMLMIHNPAIVLADEPSFNNAEKLREKSNELSKTADTLDKIKSQIISIYKDKSNLQEDEIDALMNGETWLTASEALNKGFCTEIEKGKKAVNCLYNLESYGYKNIPRNLLRPQIKLQDITIRDYEQSLRDWGFSAQDAKLLASVGFPKPDKMQDASKDEENNNQLYRVLKEIINLI